MTRSQQNPEAWAYFEKHAQYIAPNCYYIMYFGKEFFESDTNILCPKFFEFWNEKKEKEEFYLLIQQHVSPRK